MTVIEIQPSRLLVILVVAMHVAAAFSFLLGVSDVGLRGVCLVMLVASLLHFLCVSRRRGFRCLGLQEEGVLLVEPEGRGEFEACLLPATVVLNTAVWLVWRQSAGKKRGAEVLLPDQLSPAHWRALQIWARLRARPAGAPQQGGSL